MVRSSCLGAVRWIGFTLSVLTSPLLSIVFPKTSKSLPKVSGPTGTEIGEPLSLTSVPLTNPSVESIATVRTAESPKCCATSKTKVLSSPRSTVKAL